AYRQSGTAEIDRRGPKKRPTFFGRARGGAGGLSLPVAPLRACSGGSHRLAARPPDQKRRIGPTSVPSGIVSSTSPAHCKNAVKLVGQFLRQEISLATTCRAAIPIVKDGAHLVIDARYLL